MSRWYGHEPEGPAPSRRAVTATALAARQPLRRRLQASGRIPWPPAGRAGVSTGGNRDSDGVDRYSALPRPLTAAADCGRGRGRRFR